MHKDQIRAVRQSGIGALVLGAAAGVSAFLASSNAPAVNVLVASAVLAVLGALLITISLAAYLYEARDIASLQALADETRKNLYAARQLASEMRMEREARAARRDHDLG